MRGQQRQEPQLSRRKRRRAADACLDRGEFGAAASRKSREDSEDEQDHAGHPCRSQQLFLALKPASLLVTSQLPRLT
jgi:hypothetical protein